MDFKNDEIILVLSIRTKITKTIFLSSILIHQAIIGRTKGKINWSNDTIKHPIKFDKLKRNHEEKINVDILPNPIFLSPSSNATAIINIREFFLLEKKKLMVQEICYIL